MTLQLKLVLLYALSMALVLIGMGATLFLYLRQNLQTEFQQDLGRLALTYGQQIQTVKPQKLLLSPVSEEIKGALVYLLDSDSKVVHALTNQPLPDIPKAALTKAQAGQTTSFELKSSETHPLWRVPFLPQSLPLERDGILQPIKTSQGTFIIFVSATNIGLVRGLSSMGNSLTLWSLISILVVTMVGFLLSQFVTKPLQDISLTALAIRRGELSSRIANAKGKDEMARLKQQLNAMLEQLESLVEAQRNFTADAAHDLRTPLAVIRGELEIALRKPRSAESYRETLERLRQEVKEFSALAEDLLLLSRLEAGQQKPQHRLNVLQILESTLTASSVAARQRQVVFQVHIPPKLEVSGDARALARAVGNLLQNALTHGLRYHKPPPILVNDKYKDTLQHHFDRAEFGLEVMCFQNVVQFRVFNSGETIPSEQRDGIFARFRKGDHSSGTGLGLAIVAQVAQQHTGRIYYEPRIGGGSVFVLEIPA